MLRRVVRKLVGRDLLHHHARELERLHDEARIGTALSRAAATAAARTIDPLKPSTWEFSGFSQHGEDGITDYLVARLLAPNRFFIEVGAGDGIENCTAWLVHASHIAGIWVEGNAVSFAKARRSIEGRAGSVECVHKLVDRDNIGSILKLCPYKDPDVFSLDIDSIDYYIAERVLELGVRPRIWIVEYNSTFGPDRAVTVPYRAGFNRWEAHWSGLYYGCSIGAWHTFFGRHEYAFITVDLTGTNAYFIDLRAFPPGFTDGMEGKPFREDSGDRGAIQHQVDDAGDRVAPSRDWRSRYRAIAEMPLVEL